MGDRDLYFYDISLRDIAGAMNRGLAILYYGAMEGTFGGRKSPPVPLDRFNAIQFKLRIPPSIPSKRLYKNQVLFLRKELANDLWHERSLNTTRVVRRVSLTKKPSLKHHRIARIFTPESRPIHLAQFTDRWTHAQRVPAAYSDYLKNEFEVFFLRADADTQVMHLICDTINRSLVDSERRDIHSYGDIYGPQAPVSHLPEEACVSAFRFE
ncbi:hypothetical protein [Sulfuriroseicoccus oceanibius]|uniref:Uncharacterized protein n=1 Tax=Sulfuriroseicoccus oceanibius TaxID=2707525 RepID=A0A6B3L707_9BACT|nr:hypothetical protein [Sulfuriroseicoccus oceanibius]QQL45056.1 hypothetical protein G3M56_000260 [Sulfuriroseicoccus oceanibius]